jgi:hypothetical protein
MQTLKKLAVAYRLSLTHGYCPADLEEAQELAEEEVEIPLGFSLVCHPTYCHFI